MYRSGKTDFEFINTVQGYEMQSIAVIGGTGLEDVLGGGNPRTFTTPYGDVSIGELELGGRRVLFLPRHGREHTIPPHRINYRANIAALHQAGCRCVIATNAVGAIRRDMLPGDVVIIDQFIDFTHGRPGTFYNGDAEGLRHVDMTEPYCPHLRNLLAKSAATAGLTVHSAGTYVCTEGPRFETPAEIEMFARLGGDVVGMTGVPEVVLAREKGLCYAGMCLVSNLAAGLSGERISEEEVVELGNRCREAVAKALKITIEALDPDFTCKECDTDE